MPIKRDSRRYLKFWIESCQKFNSKEVISSIQKCSINLYGIYGLYHLKPVLICFDVEKQDGILRCNGSYLWEMRAVLTFITKIRGVNAAIFIEKVSGIVKKLR